MNAEKLYDAFAQIDEDLIGDAAGTVLRVRTINPRRIVAAAVALFFVGAGVAAVYLIHDGRANNPGIDGVIQTDYPHEGSAVDGENSEKNRPDEPESNYFGSYDLEGFLGFIKNGGKTPAHTGGHLWSEYEENAEFIEWVNGKAQIPVPVTASGFKVTYSCVGEKEYSFYISGDSGKKLTAQLTVCEIPSGETSDLSEIVRRYMAESGKAFYDRHPWKSEFQGEETTSICPPVLFFRYGDYLIKITDRRKPEADKWDIHFLDCFDLEMYEMQK